MKPGHGMEDNKRSQEMYAERFHSVTVPVKFLRILVTVYSALLKYWSLRIVDRYI
jgi:hypothetical protein